MTDDIAVCHWWHQNYIWTHMELWKERNTSVETITSKTERQTVQLVLAKPLWAIYTHSFIQYLTVVRFFHFYFSYFIFVITCFYYLYCVHHFYSVDWSPVTNRICLGIKKVFLISDYKILQNNHLSLKAYEKFDMLLYTDILLIYLISSVFIYSGEKWKEVDYIVK